MIPKKERAHTWYTQPQAHTHSHIDTLKAPTFFALLCFHMSEQPQSPLSTECSQQQPTSSSSPLPPFGMLCVYLMYCCWTSLKSYYIQLTHCLLLSILMSMPLYAIIIISFYPLVVWYLFLSLSISLRHHTYEYSVYRKSFSGPFSHITFVYSKCGDFYPLGWPTWKD